MTTFTVINSNDTGAGSLRAAIAAAQSGDTIVFDRALANQKIALSSGQLAIATDLTIDGSAAKGLTISGNNQSRVFDIASNLNVTLRGLTLIDGKTSGTAVEGAGAGIRTGNGTTLTLENSTLRNNFANGDGGGGLWAGNNSTTTIENSNFEGNSTAGLQAPGNVGERGGGAIAVASGSMLTVTSSTFTDNEGINGGAINSLLSTLEINGSLFRNNDTRKGGNFGPDTRGYGGAIYVDGGKSGVNDTISILGSRIENNQGAGQGGGVFIFTYADDQATIKDSTIIGNSVVKDRQNLSLGGGIRIGGNAPASIINTTVANNRALDQGGGLWSGGNSPLTIGNSTFEGNRAESADGKQGLGGAMLLANNPPVEISDSTIANNIAGFQGGGFWGGGNRTILKNSIVANNRGNSPFNTKHQSGERFRDGGGNVEYNPYNPNDPKVAIGSTVVNPEIPAIADNGEALQTPPRPGNPAVTVGAQESLNGTVYDGPSFVNPGTNPGNQGDGRLVPNQNNIFTLTGESEQLTFDIAERNTAAINEVAIFRVDDEQGTINGIAPGEDGYAAAALNNSQIVFSALATVFPNINPDRQINLNPGERFGFYLVQNSTTDQLRLNPPVGGTPDNLFFGTAAANRNGSSALKVSNLDKEGYNLAWEDRFGGSEDFNDLKMTVKATQNAPVIGTTLTGGAKTEIIDLRQQQGMVPLTIAVNSDAAYSNSFGLYAIDDLSGRIGDLKPGDAGYAAAAVRQQVDLEGLIGGRLFAPFFIANGTSEQFLSQNPDNTAAASVNAYFSYLGANPDRVDRVRLLGDNTFGFEDFPGGGDLDYNDYVVQFDFSV